MKDPQWDAVEGIDTTMITKAAASFGQQYEAYFFYHIPISPPSGYRF